MGFWNNLGAGLAEAAGAPDVAERFRAPEKQKADLAHAELEAKSNDLFDRMHAARERRAKLDPNSPTYAQDAAQIDKALSEGQQAFYDLYHPTKNPGALQHLGGFIKSHIGRRKPANPPKTPAEAKVSFGQVSSDLDQAAFGSSQAANPILVKRKQMQDAGFSPEQIAQVEAIDHNLAPKPGVEKPEKPGKEEKPPKLTADERKRQDYAEWQKTHKNWKGTYEEWAYSQSHPPKPPKPPTPAKLGSVQVDAQKKYLEAGKISQFADFVAQHPNDAVNQKRLAVQLERLSAGRFTTQALDYVIKAGWGNTLEQWANNPTTGALPSDVVRQLVDGAHEVLTEAKKSMDESMTLPTTMTPAQIKSQVKGGGTNAPTANGNPYRR